MIYAIACLVVAQANVFDQGTYQTYIKGVASSKEGFRILANGRSSSIVSTVSGGTVHLKAKTELATSQGAMVSAVVNVVGEKTIMVSLKNDEVVFDVQWVASGSNPAQREVTRIPTHGERVYCSEPFAWHQLSLMMRGYDVVAGGEQQMRVAMPSQVRLRDFVLTRKEPRDHQGKMVVDWSFGSPGAPATISAISDPEGRLLYVRDEGVGAEVVRTGWESLAKASVIEPPVEPTPSPLQPNRDKYDERQVKIWVGSTVNKAGTLLMPKAPGKRPAVLMVGGFGPTDRDWNSPPLSTNSWGRLLADHLAGAGYAVLRTDDRGVGQTQGAKELPTPQEALSDLLMEADFLKAQPEIDPFAIFVMGHDEGGIYALQAITTDATLAGAILLGTPSKSFDQALLEGLAVQQADMRLPQSAREQVAASVPSFSEAIAKAKAGQKGKVNNLSLEWLRQHMAINPSELASRAKDPILIIQGLDDLVVASRNASELQQAAAATGVEVKVEFIPGVTHYFTPFPFENPDYSPAAAGEMSPTVAKTVISWLDSVVARALVGRSSSP